MGYRERTSIYPLLTHNIRAGARAILGLGVRDNHNLHQRQVLSTTYQAPHTLLCTDYEQF